jgi:regulator of PEP synthase PpsR (kinase-PPPase family)
MNKTIKLSTSIDSKIKETLVKFCKRRGLKIQHFVEKAIIEHLEDEIDLEAIHERRNEKTIPLKKLIQN